MKKIRFIVSFCILFIGVLIIGESHVFYLDNFYTKFAYTTMYKQPHTTDEEMINDILASAKQNKVEVFTYIRSPKSIFLTEFDIYGSSEVENYINQEMNIQKGEYSSLFMGNLRFSFSSLKDIGKMDAIHEFYVIGRGEQVHAFKMSLIDKYAGNHPQEGYGDTGISNTIIGIWILIASIIIFMTFYNALLIRKESLIQISMGESAHSIVWRLAIIDAIILSAQFFLVTAILSRFTYVWFKFEFSLSFFLLMLLLNALCYTSLYRHPIKEAFSNSVGSKKLLTLNYGLKSLTAIITILVISSNLVFIIDSLNLYKQKPFFQEFADYEYISLQYKPVPAQDGSVSNALADSAKVQTHFYEQFFHEFKPTSFVNISNLTKVEGILANQNSYHYLSRQIKELKEIPLSDKVYFVIPKGLSKDKGIVKKMADAVRFYEGADYRYQHEAVYYDEPATLISIDENYTYGSKRFKNPVIIFNNMHPEGTASDSNPMQKMNVLHDVMYNVENKAFTRFIEEHKLEHQIVSRTNVLENFENKWTTAKRVLYMNVVFSVLVVIMEILIISSIIKLEYEINAVELAVKKVVGYSPLEKHKRLAILTVSATVLSIGLSMAISLMLNLIEFYYLLISGITIIALEIAVMLFFIHRVEKAKLPKILKGGSL